MRTNIHDQMDRDCYSKDDNTRSEIVVILDGADPKMSTQYKL